MLTVVNEQSTAYLTCTFNDKNGQPAAPTSVSYRIDDVGTGNQVRGDTAIAAAPSVEIELNALDNAIITAGKANTRKVTVTATYGANDLLRSDFIYSIRNLAEVA